MEVNKNQWEGWNWNIQETKIPEIVPKPPQGNTAPQSFENEDAILGIFGEIGPDNQQNNFESSSLGISSSNAAILPETLDSLMSSNADKLGQASVPNEEVPSAEGTAKPITLRDVMPCYQDCKSTRQYSPVCGSDGVTYPNKYRLECAQKCGVGKFAVFYSRILF